MGAHNLGGMINLQTALSYLRDDPRFYNPLAWLICAPLFIAWAITTLRTSSTLSTSHPTPHNPDSPLVPQSLSPSAQSLVPSAYCLVPESFIPLAAIAILT